MTLKLGFNWLFYMRETDLCNLWQLIEFKTLELETKKHHEGLSHAAEMLMEQVLAANMAASDIYSSLKVMTLFVSVCLKRQTAACLHLNNLVIEGEPA